MSGPARRRLEALLAKWRPTSVVVIGNPAGAGTTPDTITRLEPAGAAEALDSLGRFDCALVGPGDAVRERALLLLLGRLKNVHAPRIVLQLDERPGAELRDALLELAFEPDAETAELWIHDIDRYNPQREWNTPEHWANPENFDKYRW